MSRGTSALAHLGSEGSRGSIGRVTGPWPGGAGMAPVGLGRGCHSPSGKGTGPEGLPMSGNV